MPLGKKIRSVDQHAYLDGRPRVVIFGHSMPKRLFRCFNDEMIPRDYLYHFGERTVQQAYAHYLGVDQLYGEVDFVHCSGILHRFSSQKVDMVKQINPQVVLVHGVSNDLAVECVSEEAIASCLLETFENVIADSDVKVVIFVSELKRADEEGFGGRLKCSASDFEVRVKEFNRIMKESCKKRKDIRFEWLPGMWFDVNKRELEVWEWSSDNLHPGTDTSSGGFYKYYNAIRQVLLKSYHQVASQI